MSEALQTCDRQISLDIRSVISSPASVDGATRSDSPAGPMLGPYGPDPALASLSRKQVAALAQQTNATFGPYGAISFSSAALQQSLVSRLRARLQSSGSTLFKLTWKADVTPSQRLIYRLRASVLRTSGKDCTSWPTPTACSPNSLRGNGQDPEKRIAGGHTVNLQDAVRLASWLTTTAVDGRRGNKDARPWDTGRPLPQIAALASWISPSARDWKDTPGMAITREDGRSRLDQLPRQAQLAASGETLTLSTAETASCGQLNPAHSRWLMGYPPVWDDSGVTAMPSTRSSPRRSSRATST